jgi:hypothetical protein
MPADVRYVDIAPTDGGSTIRAYIQCEAPFAYGIDESGPGRTVTYKIPGDRATVFVDSIKGIGNYTGSVHSYPSPHQYPNNTNLRCVRAGLHEFRGAKRPDPQLMRAKYSLIRADYAVIPFSADGLDYSALFGMAVPWTKVDIDIGTEDYDVPDTTTADGDLIRHATVTLPVVTYAFRRTMIPNLVAYKTIAAGLSGTICDDVFFGEARGTVKFETFGMREDQDPSGRRVFEFALMLKWRPEDWNKIPSPGKFQSWTFNIDADGHMKYAYESFLPILQYGLV